MNSRLAKLLLVLGLVVFTANAFASAVYSDCLRFLDKTGNLVAPVDLPGGMKVVTVNGKDAFCTKEPTDDKDLGNPYNFLFNAPPGFIGQGAVGLKERDLTVSDTVSTSGAASGFFHLFFCSASDCTLSDTTTSIVEANRFQDITQYLFPGGTVPFTVQVFSDIDGQNGPIPEPSTLTLLAPVVIAGLYRMGRHKRHI